MKSRAGWMALGFILAATFLGCASETSDKSLAFINPTEAETLFAGKKKLLGLGGETSAAWIDPRSVEDYREAHIPGAIHVPLETVNDAVEPLKEYDTLIVYGDDYNSPIATAMSKTLIELGCKNVKTLRGGLRAWQTAGNPVDTATPGD